MVAADMGKSLVMYAFRKSHLLKGLPLTECRVSEMCVSLQRDNTVYAIYNDEVPHSGSISCEKGHTKGTGRIPSFPLF